MSPSPPTPQAANASRVKIQDEKQQRLDKALRQNLFKRKQQQRSRQQEMLAKAEKNMKGQAE